MKAHATALLSIFFLAAASSAYAAVPAAPTGVTRARINSTQVRIRWTDRSTDETGFEILRRLETDVVFESRGTVGADVVEFIDDAPTTEVYIYEVRAFNVDGNSGASNICYVNRPTLGTPVTFAVKLIALTVVRVSWTDRSYKERGFEVQRADFGKSFKTIARLPPNTVNYEDDTLKPANTYTYRVRAFGRPAVCLDNSNFTVERTVTTVGGVRILQVERRGGGKGSVTSVPAGISCSAVDDHCTAKFPLATFVKLTAKPKVGSKFGDWADYAPCKGVGNVCSVYIGGTDHVLGAAFRIVH